jgi:RIO-like serine/threonine protein kinase
MKLDVNALRYLSKDDFRVLTATEMGQKNHEIVPLQLIDSISGLKHGGAFKCIKVLLRHKLLHHDGSTYDGYRSVLSLSSPMHHNANERSKNLPLYISQANKHGI